MLATLERIGFSAEKDDSEGRKLGLSGLDILMVILGGLGDTDLNHTVLFGITWSPTYIAAGSLAGITLDSTNRDTL